MSPEISPQADDDPDVNRTMNLIWVFILIQMLKSYVKVSLVIDYILSDVKIKR